MKNPLDTEPISDLRNRSGNVNPLNAIRKNHRFHIYVCDAIEEVANDLPDRIDPDRCMRIADTLTRELPMHHADEEQGLFPLLNKRSLPEDRMPNILQELARQHAIDSDQAAELLDPMSRIATGKTVKNPDMLGYMFRSFVETYRRHLIWEIEFLLPLAHKRLYSEDLVDLKIQMMNHREKPAKLMG